MKFSMYMIDEDGQITGSNDSDFVIEQRRLHGCAVLFAQHGVAMMPGQDTNQYDVQDAEDDQDKLNEGDDE